MEQQPLDFAHTHTRRTDPATSRRAAESMLVGSEAQRQAVYWALLQAGRPLTADEIAMREAMTIEQVCRRLSDLQKQGRAEPTDDTRATRSGRVARCWRLRELGGAA